MKQQIVPYTLKPFLVFLLSTYMMFVDLKDTLLVARFTQRPRKFETVNYSIRLYL
jgi:hypothetical protein